MMYLEKLVMIIMKKRMEEIKKDKRVNKSRNFLSNDSIVENSDNDEDLNIIYLTDNKNK